LFELVDIPRALDSRRRPQIAVVHEEKWKKVEENIKEFQLQELTANKKPFLRNSFAHHQKSPTNGEGSFLNTMSCFDLLQL